MVARLLDKDVSVFLDDEALLSFLRMNIRTAIILKKCKRER